MSEQNFRVVVIGAGMAGMLAAIKLQQAGYEDVAIYEKADRIGLKGTIKGDRFI